MKRRLVDPLLLQTLQVLNQPAKQHMGLNFSAENGLCNSRHKCMMTYLLSITLQRFGWSQEEWGLLGCCNCQPSEVSTPPTPWVLFSLFWFPTPANLGFVRRDVGGGWEFIGLWDWGDPKGLLTRAQKRMTYGSDPYIIWEELVSLRETYSKCNVA
jgi:hypothetical protein